MDFEVKYRNERDVEIPLLLEFIRKHKDIEKALDVGCARSVYLEKARELIKIFDCIDIEADQKASPFLDNYFLGDVIEKDLDIYDLVFAISVIEHYGVKQKPASCPLCSQKDMIKKLASLAKKYLFLSFPYGQPYTEPGEFIVISKDKLEYYLPALKDFNLKIRYYINDNLQAESKWYEVDQFVADASIYDKKYGIRCVCIVEGIRKDV